MSILKKAIDPLGITDKLFGGSNKSAPQMDPRLIENAGKMSEIGRDSYAWNLAEANRLQPLYRNLSGQTGGIVSSAIDRSGRVGNQYDSTFMPVNEQVARDAMTWDYPQAQEAAAGRAITDTASAFNRMRGQMRGNFARYGMNPNNFQSQNYMLGVEQARAEAGSANKARTDRQLQGATMRTSAANLGRGILQDSTSQGGLALTGANTTSGILGQGMDAYNTGTNAALPWFTGANNAFQGIYGNQMQQYNTDMQRDANKWAGIGQLVGTGVGFMVGGPAGAMVGSQAGRGITAARGAPTGSPFTNPY